MENKPGFFPLNFSRMGILIIFILTSSGLLSGCDVIRRMIPNGDRDEDLSIPMSAVGKFESFDQNNSMCGYIENEITIRWNAHPNTGLSTFSGGNGKRYTDCNGTYANLDLVFENGSIQGDKLSGTVHAKGLSNPLPGQEEMLEFDANWTAVRRGDYFEGVVDGMGGFILKVQPAPEDWQEDE